MTNRNLSMIKNMTLIFLSLIILSSTLYSYELSYGILDDCLYIDQRLRSFTFLYLQEKMPENLPIIFPHENELLYAEILIKNEKLIVVRNSSSGDDEIYVYNSFNDSIHYIQAEGITNIKNPVLVKLRIPTLQQGTNSQPSLIKLFGLYFDKMLFGCADFRYGLLKINDKEYFIGLVNNHFDYSNLENTILYIDINNDGHISDIDSLDAFGNSAKEVFQTNDSFILDGEAYSVDSISVNGYTIEISRLDLIEKYAVGYTMPAFRYFNSAESKYETYENSDDVILIFVWSSGCSASRKYILIINALYEKYKENDGFRFLSLSSDNLVYLEQHKHELDIEFPFYAHNPQLKEVLGKSVPRTVVIDSDGIIKVIFEGYFISKEIPENIEDNENYKKIDEYLHFLLNNKK